MYGVAPSEAQAHLQAVAGPTKKTSRGLPSVDALMINLEDGREKESK